MRQTWEDRERMVSMIKPPSLRVWDSQRANYKENIPAAAAGCAAVCGLGCHSKPCKGVGKDSVLAKRLINGSLALLQ